MHGVTKKKHMKMKNEHGELNTIGIIKIIPVYSTTDSLVIHGFLRLAKHATKGSKLRVSVHDMTVGGQSFQ